jgi:ketosteroid isomerase-like protein
MTISNLPAPITAFLDATAARDSRALLASFTSGAVLTDMGKFHQGAAIAEWNDRLFIGANVKIHPIHLADRDGQTVLTVIVDGDYASFGVTEAFQLDWLFSLKDGKIAGLRMVQEKDPDVPAPVLAYIKATNSFDLDACVAAFADDALVNDQQREYVGRGAIREWAAREIVGDRVTMFVTKAMRRGDDAVVTADIDGDYDKTGLPAPLTLTFYFSVRGDRIVQLIILRNKAASGSA